MHIKELFVPLENAIWELSHFIVVNRKLVVTIESSSKHLVENRRAGQILRATSAHSKI